MKKNILSTLLCCFWILNSQNLKINEVVTQNIKGISDLSGSHPDWIEIYNPTKQTINLRGYSLSDKATDKQKFTFKNGKILPDSFIVVFASDVAHDSLIGQRQSVEDLTTLGWHYGDKSEGGTSEVTFTKFSNSIFGTLNGKNAVAGKIYLGPASSLGYSYAGIHVKFKNWDTEVDRSGYDLLRVRLFLEKDKKAMLRFAQTGVDEWLNPHYPITGTGDTTWYEIPIVDKVGKLDLSKLTGLSLLAPDNAYGQSFEFVMLNIQFSVAALERFHTNFKLSSNGENIFLSAPDKTTLDIAIVPALTSDISYGRKTDGVDTWVFFEKPTPNKSNQGNTIIGICNKTLLFDKNAGFYNGQQQISISGASEIRYTLDGSIPTATSMLYSKTLTIDTTTVVTAACFDGNTRPKQIFTNTYILDYQTTLPVFSISTNPENFFDLDSGIYVLGRDSSYETNTPYFGANFWEDWERPIHVEFFEEDHAPAFEIDCGVKIFGNYSRANDKKSLSLNFRNEYGASKLDYPIFPEYPGIESFKNLLLRSAGGDAYSLHFRDGFHALLADGLDFEKMKYRPAVVFINGKYWGLHNIREKSNQEYFEENYNVKEEDIDLITAFFSEQKGPTTVDYVNFQNRLENEQVGFTEISNFVDLNSLTDYSIYEIYLGNYDWPGNNNKYWRQSSTKSKWRWFLYDTDYTTGIYNNKGDTSSGTSYQYNHFKQATTFTPDVFWPNNKSSTALLRECLKNPAFQQKFINRYCDLINTLFIPDSVFKLLSSKVISKIESEVPKNNVRWGISPNDWYTAMEVYKEYWEKRPTYARNHMKSQLNLQNEVKLILNIYPKGSGYIKLNSLEIDDPSWSGIYYKGVPVNMEAIPNPGYSFTGWNSSMLELDNPSNAKIINLDLTSDNTFTANFEGTPLEQSITISEINYNSPPEFDTHDWLELHNYGAATVDLSNWYLKDLKEYNKFIIPTGTVLGPNARIIVAQNKDSFALIHKTIPAIGSLNFNLSNSGETVYLYDNRNHLIQQIKYSDTAPWAKYADGLGGTLELTDPKNDISDPNSWASVCFGGSPTFGYDPSCPQKLTNVFDDKVENGIKILPNPAKDLLTVTLKDGEFHKLSILSLDGVQQMESNEDSVRISNLNPGIYLIKIETKSDFIIVDKIVVE